MFLLLLKFSGGSGLQPHRLERHIRSTDPDFETKVADVIGLYLDPRQHAVVFGVDEKTAIQALDEGREPRYADGSIQRGAGVGTRRRAFKSARTSLAGRAVFTSSSHVSRRRLGRFPKTPSTTRKS